MILTALVAAVLVTAVGLIAITDDPPRRAGPDDAAYAVQHLRARLSTASRTPRPYTDLAELLGNTRFARGGAVAAETDAVIVGDIVAVSPGRGFVPLPESDMARTMDARIVDFDDPAAMWRSLHITVAVTRVLSGQLDTRVVIGQTIDGVRAVDAERVIAGLRALPATLWFLRRRSPVFDYDRSLWSGIEDGALLGVIGADRQIELPLSEDGRSLLAATPSIDALERASRRSSRVVELRRDGAAWVRAAS